MGYKNDSFKRKHSGKLAPRKCQDCRKKFYGEVGGDEPICPKCMERWANFYRPVSVKA